MKQITDVEKQIPVLQDVDVVVVGGGAAGSLAAVAAARHGASTVLIERTGTLGGVATTDFMGNMNNRFIRPDGTQVLGGLTWEMMERLVKEGGTAFDDVMTTLKGNLDVAPQNVQFRPEVLAYVLLTMAKEAGVRLMFHTQFSHMIGGGKRPDGVVVVGKSGPGAVLAKTIVDASGDADVAAAAGAPCRKPNTSWGLLMRLGNVDFDEVMEMAGKLTPWEPWPEFGEWLANYLGKPLEELEEDRYWSKIIDPVLYDHVAQKSPGDREFTQEKLAWIQERWKRAGVFYNFELPLLRHYLKAATDAGDLDIVKKIEGFGELRLNWDGFAIGAWGSGIALVNSCHAMAGFDGTSTEHVSRAELEGRIYCMEIARFMRKYLPGFEDSYLLDMGWQFVPRFARMIEGEFEFTSQDELRGKSRTYPDAIFVSARGGETYSEPRHMPYRVLVPKLVDNVLVAGKCASSANYFRSIAACMAMGEAAGAAASILAKSGVTNRDLDPKDLHRALRDQGVILDIPGQ